MTLGWIAVARRRSSISPRCSAIAWFGDRRAAGAVRVRRAAPASVPMRCAHLGLLHVLDLLRLGRRRVALGPRLPADLYRPDPPLHRRLSAAAPRGARRPRRSASPPSPTSWAPATARTSASRWSTALIAVVAVDPLHRAAAEGGLRLASRSWCPASSSIVIVPGLRRPRAARRARRSRSSRSLFGTRHADATEHQDGMVLAVAVEAIVKLFAFLAVGLFVTFVLFDGPVDLTRIALARSGDRRDDRARPARRRLAGADHPRGLRVPAAAAPVPHHGGREQQPRRACAAPRWLFPAYLVAINVFVVPIAWAGMLGLGGGVDARLLRAGGAARQRRRSRHADRLHRRPLGRHRHGDRGERRAGRS